MGKVWKQQMYPQYTTYYYPQYLQAKVGSGTPGTRRVWGWPRSGRPDRAEPGREPRGWGTARGRRSGCTGGRRQERAGSPFLPPAAAPGVPAGLPPLPLPPDRAVSDLTPLSPFPSRCRSLLFPGALGVSPPSQPRPRPPRRRAERCGPRSRCLRPEQPLERGERSRSWAGWGCHGRASAAAGVL